MTWRPLLEGDLALRSLQAVEDVARALESPEGTAWFTPPDRLPEWQREIHPAGLYNLGVAHGIPAVAALLAIACRSGVAAYGLFLPGC